MPIRFNPAPLVVDDPWDRVESFFERDISSLKYDRYIASGVSPQSRIVIDDVKAINESMSARSPHHDWDTLIRRGDLPELVAIDAGWDLVTMPDGEWDDARVPQRLEALLTAVVGKGIGISRATKVLHIKRPGLVS